MGQADVDEEDEAPSFASGRCPNLEIPVTRAADAHPATALPASNVLPAKKATSFTSDRCPNLEIPVSCAAAAHPVAVVPTNKVPPAKEGDFFNELGMEPVYKAPRTLAVGMAGQSLGKEVDSMLEETSVGVQVDCWGQEDLNLDL